jgi:hypothetical protein
MAIHGCDEKHYYYSHKSTCPKGGFNRIDAEVVHRLVLGWLRDIVENGEKFQQLKEEGRRRIGRRISELEKALSSLKKEKADLEEEVELRIQQLVRTSTEKLRKTIEESISGKALSNLLLLPRLALSSRYSKVIRADTFSARALLISFLTILIITSILIIASLLKVQELVWRELLLKMCRKR